MLVDIVLLQHKEKQPRQTSVANVAANPTPCMSSVTTASSTASTEPSESESLDKEPCVSDHSYCLTTSGKS